MESDSKRSRALSSYSNLATSENNLTVTAGRRREDAATEPMIFADTIHKLRVSRNERGLDIGCGCGTLAMLWDEKAKLENLQLTMLDFPAVISRLKSTLKSKTKNNIINFISGIFPDELSEALEPESYDFIVLYSVLHYSDDPSNMIDAAVNLLRPGGRLLVGDIPNISRKGRFLSTSTGRAFDASYHNIPLVEAKHFKNHHEFVELQTNTKDIALDDRFILNTLNHWRDQGLDTYILPQPLDLPFSLTREDLLIIKSGI